MAHKPPKSGQVPPSAPPVPLAIGDDERLWTRNFALIWIINLSMSVWAFMLQAPFPFYILHLGGNELLIGITAGAVSVAALLVRPFAGWFLDNISRSILLLLGPLVIILSLVLLLTIPVLGIAIMLRIFLGFLFSATSTGSATNAADAIPPQRFGEGIGLLGLGNTLGTALGPMIGLTLIGSLGFEALFIVSAAMMALTFFAARGFKFKKFDKSQRRTIRFKALFNKDAIPASLVLLLASLPFGGVVIFVALYGEHYGIGQGSWYFVLIAVGSGTARLLGGRLIDRWGEKPMVWFGNACFVLGLVLLVLHTPVAYYLSGLAFGLGFGVMNPAMQAMAMRTIPIEKRGSATSTFQLSHDISGGLGGVLAGWLVTHWGYQVMFGTLIIFVFFSTAVYIFWAAKSKSAFEVWKVSG